MQKKCYVVYFRNLQQALDCEMKFTKVIKFSQKEWCLKQFKPKTIWFRNEHSTI